MGRSSPTIWRLFVDESGNFSDPDDEVVVAGLLLRDGAAGSDSEQIRASLQQAVPGLPWPIKASEINHPVVFALLPDADPERARLRVHLQGALPEDFAAASDALAEGRRLPYQAVANLDREARQRRDEYAAFRRQSDRTIASIGRLIEQLASSESSPGGAVFVGCGETVRGYERETGDDSDIATCRYESLLQWLMVRAMDVLHRYEGRHRLHLHVLERHVWDRQLSMQAPLHSRHIAPLRLAAERISGGATHRVELKFDEVARYDDRAHAGLVLADFMANRARAALLRRSESLDEVEAALGLMLRCPVRSGEPGASHLAAAGAAQRLIELGRGGGEVTEGFPLTEGRRWPAEQAAQWIEVFRR